MNIARALLVYGLVLIAAWGVGSAVLSALRPGSLGKSRLARPVIAIALGFGVIGETLFLVGLIGPFFRPGFMALLLAIGVGLAIYQLRRDHRTPAGPARIAMALTLFESVVITFSAVYLARWFWVLSGFTVGSDVFSHHYAHAKHMIGIQRFGRAAALPFGLDNISNYNPALMHMLFVPTHMLADERASNLIHWTAQLLLFGGLYILAVELRSRSAGFLAIGIYLTVGLLGNFPMDVNDYTLTGVFLLLAVYCIVVYGARQTRGMLCIAGCVAGMMAATKYYGLVALPVLCGLLLVVAVEPWGKRLRSVVVFATIALAFFIPWALYNVFTVGNPFYPIMSHDLMPRIFGAINPVHMVEQFVAPADRGFLIPRSLEYLAYLIPYSPGDVIFGLSGLFLILIPVSLFYLLRRRWGRAREANLLFLFSAALFAMIFIAIYGLAFPKWAFFPALTFAVSIAVLAEDWTRASRAVLLAAVVFFMTLNYYYIGSPYIRAFGPHTSSQRERWDSTVRYLNETLPSEAVIAGVQYLHNYYLRADITGIEELGEMGVDWPFEEAMLRRVRTEYFITYPATDKARQDWYTSLIEIWKQLSPGHPAIAFLEDFTQRVRVRDGRKAEFIARSGVPVHRFLDGTTLYRLKW